MVQERIIESASIIKSVFEKIFKISKTINKQNKAIDNAVSEIFGLLDPKQAEYFYHWILSFKISTFLNFSFSSTDKAIETLMKKLNKVLVYLNLNDETKKVINEKFISSLLIYIKEDRPIDYLINLVDEIKREELEIAKLIKDNFLSYDTYFTVNDLWISHTENPTIGVDFFSLTNDRIVEDLKDLVNKNISFCVSHYCSEEAALMLLSTINGFGLAKQIYLVNNLRTWKYFEKSNISDSILIFCGKIDGTFEINEITNNICIYILNDDESYAGLREVVKLSRWYKKDLEEKLKSYGCSTSRIVYLINKSNGLFHCLKASLWKGIVPLFEEYKDQKDIIKFLLVYPRFTNDDYNYLSSVFGDYQLLKEKLEIVSMGENPIMIIPKNGFRIINRVSDGAALWSKYSKLIISDIDYIFKASNCLFIENVSRDLKCGYLDSLSYLCCLSNSDSQSRVDNLIYDLLKKFHSNGDFSYGGIGLYEYVEPSPKGVLKYIEEYKEDLSSLYLNRNDNYKDTIDITYALDVLVTYTSYAKRGYLLSAYFASIQDSSESNVHPIAKDVISTLYIPWFNYSGLSTKQRIDLGIKIFSQYKKLGGLIIDSLSAISGPVTSIRYDIRIRNNDNSVSNSDYHDLKNKLANVVFVESSICELSYYLQKLNRLCPDIEACNLILERIKANIDSIDDDEKFVVIENIREFVYDCKYYNRDIYKYRNEFVESLSQLMNTIHYKNEMYSHLFIFKHSPYFFPIDNPVAYGESDDIDANHDLISKIYNYHLSVLLDEKYDFNSFLNLLNSKIANSNIQFVLCELDSNYKYEQRIVTLLCKHNMPFAASSYVKSRSIFKGAKLIEAVNQDSNPYYQASILSGACSNLSSEFLYELKKYSDDTQKCFWESFLNLKISDANIFDAVEHELLKHDTNNNWLHFLNENMNLVDVDKLISILIDNIEKVKSGVSKQLGEYYLENILKKCEASNDLNVWKKAGELEIEIYRIKRIKFNCLVKYCTYKPDLVSRIFLSIYGNTRINKKDFGNKYTLLHYSLIFCPGVIESTVDENLFRKWITDFVTLTRAEADKKYIDYYIGKILGYYIKYNFPNCVSEYIESFYSERLAEGVANSLYQPNGFEIRTVGNGSDLRLKGNEYHRISIELADNGYIKTSEIFDAVANWFYKDAERESEDAINGQY